MEKVHPVCRLTTSQQKSLDATASYADEGHELLGVLPHAYGSMEDYLRKCLTLDSDEKQQL
ncbi:hypothetical protein J6590_028071 [Homalodisca vitripennis]|nr:hypothetical protein J6590_028069 [Homalodisca vitripennis]KAG8332086.1 hypothetical protein J6590_028071 [Homalodisca vitripennis]